MVVGVPAQQQAYSADPVFSPIRDLSRSAEADEAQAQTAVCGDNVYVVWLSRSFYSISYYDRSIFFARSINNGISFSSPIKIGHTNMAQIVPIAASGSNVYVAWNDYVEMDSINTQIFFARSTDNGASFSSPIELKNGATYSYDPQIAASGSNVYVAWIDWEYGPPYLSHIFFTASTDNGASFSSPISIRESTSYFLHGSPQIAASGSYVYVAWSEGGESWDIFLRVSENSGSSFSPLINLTNNPRFVLSHSPQIVISGSNVYVVWTTWVHNYWTRLFEESYIHFAKSTDYGASFSDKKSLYYESWPSFSSLEMVVSGTNIYVAWNLGEDWILFTRSNDEGASFSSPIAFWSPDVYEDTRLKRIDFSIPKIAASGNNVYLAWTALCELIEEEERVIGTIADTFFTESTDEGNSFTDPTDISNSGESYLPQIATSGSNVVVLWQDNSLGDEEIFYRVRCEGVTFPDYSMSAIPPSLFVPPSQTATSTITILSIEGFNDIVDLKARWLPPVPSNVISQLEPNQVTPPSGGSASTTLTVTASASLSGGTFTLKISGVSRTDGIVNHLKVSIDIPDYRIRAYSISISPSQTVEEYIFIEPIDGFTDTVYLTTSWVGTQPSGMTVQLVPEQVAPPYDYCTLTVSASVRSPSYGTFTLRITGVSSPLGIMRYVDVQIQVFDYTISASPSSLSMGPSQTANSIITIQSLGGFDWYVYLDASWLDKTPSGVSFDLTDWSVYPPPDGSVSSTLMVTTSASPSAGTFTLRITGAFSDITRYVDVQIQVTGKPDYAISASPSSLTVDPSGTVTSTITVQSINNFKERVDLTWSWAPSPNGVTVQFEPSQVTPQPGGSVTSTLTVSTSASPSPGTFILRITGASLGITHSVDVSITVSSPAGRGTTSCVCTETGPFVYPEVTDMVPADPQGYSPDKSSQVTVSTIGDTPYLTLTRKDGVPIVQEVSNPAGWGFGPDSKTFVLITKMQTLSGPVFYLSLYDIGENKILISDVLNPLTWGFSPNGKYFMFTSHPYNWQPNSFLLTVYDVAQEKQTIPGITVTYATAPGDTFTTLDPEKTAEGTIGDVGWGFSPDGRTFLLAYRTSSTTYPAAYHLSLYNTPTGYSILSQDRTDVAAFWQFSPCSDILMFVTQAGTQPSTTDPVYFYYTSRPNTLYTPTPPGQIFLRSPWTPSATVVKDGTTYKIQLTGMSESSIPSPQCTTSVTTHSPVNILVTCPKGLRTGYDPTTGGEINEIPGATYTGVGSEPQTITLPYFNGSYAIEAYGLSTLTSLQEYNLTIATRDGSGEIVTNTTMTSVALAGSYQRFSFNLNEEGTITSATPETLPPQPPLLQPQVWSTNSLGNPQSTFLPQETVYVNGSNFPANQPVTIYIIPDTEDTLPSNAVAIASATTDALGTLPMTPVWSPPLMLGEYDIWVDVNQNGIYDTGDIRNDQAIGIYSFNVIPEVPFGTAMILLSMFIALGFLRLKHIRPKFRRNKNL